jgi:hypothetical protein
MGSNGDGHGGVGRSAWSGEPVVRAARRLLEMLLREHWEPGAQSRLSETGSR